VCDHLLLNLSLYKSSTLGNDTGKRNILLLLLSSSSYGISKNLYKNITAGEHEMGMTCSMCGSEACIEHFNWVTCDSGLDSSDSDLG
jgi:hypothetical protein